MSNNTQYRISIFTFVITLVVILLIPVFAKSKLLFFGERTDGKVMKKMVSYNNRGNIGNIKGFSDYFSIQFYVLDNTFEILGAENVMYDIGSKVKIAYDKKNPSNCMIVNISYIYSGLATAFAGFLLLAWITTYISFRKK